MSYRDDVDALYERASALERELEEAQAELAKLRGPAREWRETPHPLRTLPAAETTLAQLIDTFTPPKLPPPPPKPEPERPINEWITQATVDRLAKLDLESLMLIGAIVEQLALEPDSTALRARLRAIVGEISENRS